MGLFLFNSGYPVRITKKNCRFLENIDLPDIEIITGMMIPVICDECNRRFYEAAFIGAKQNQKK
jgi:hypothetical protein